MLNLTQERSSLHIRGSGLVCHMSIEDDAVDDDATTYMDVRKATTKKSGLSANLLTYTALGK